MGFGIWVTKVTGTLDSGQDPSYLRAKPAGRVFIFVDSSQPSSGPLERFIPFFEADTNSRTIEVHPLTIIA